MQICFLHISCQATEIFHCYGIGSFGAFLLPNIGTDGFQKKKNKKKKTGEFRGWGAVFNLMDFNIFLTDYQPAKNHSNAISGNPN